MEIPGVERGVVLAAFAGAVAYLCISDRMPVFRAFGSVLAGTVAAAYIGPGAIEYLVAKNVVLGERTQYAFVFVNGVAGIWVLNLIVNILKATNARASDVVAKALERLFGTGKGGGEGQ